jgi:ribosomal protein S18 acetylase RimI-like enzyme
MYSIIAFQSFLGAKMVIRQAVIADAAELAALAVRTYHDTFAAVNTPENMTAYLSAAFSVEQIAKELEDRRSTFLIAEEDRRSAGYARLLRDGEIPDCVGAGRVIELVRLYVDKRLLGAGVGAALMQACLDRAKADRFQIMFLGVWEHNTRAQAFYRKWGFKRVGEHIFQMGDDPQTDWWMMREI